VSTDIVLTNVSESPANKDKSAQAVNVSQLIHAQEFLVKTALFAKPDNVFNNPNALVMAIADQDILATTVTASKTHHHNLNALVIMTADQDTHATTVNVFKINPNAHVTMIADPEKYVKVENVSNNHNAAAIMTAHTERPAKTANADFGEILLLNDVHFTLLL
jgi:hypothetical protein